MRASTHFISFLHIAADKGNAGRRRTGPFVSKARAQEHESKHFDIAFTYCRG
jgi:hypothetical protein